MNRDNVIGNRTLHRLALGLAAAALVITTSIALFDAPLASANPSRDARRVAQHVMSRKARARPKKVKPKKRQVLEGVVNINTASESQLSRLPGIGPAKAERIVDYRKKRGPFRRVRDLRRVKGIGRMTVKRLGRHLTVRGPTTLH